MLNAQQKSNSPETLITIAITHSTRGGHHQLFNCGRKTATAAQWQRSSSDRCKHKQMLALTLSRICHWFVVGHSIASMALGEQLCVCVLVYCSFTHTIELCTQHSVAKIALIPSNRTFCKS